MPWLFSYGSNHPGQLSERLGRTDWEMQSGRLDDHWRVFRGYSQRWRGGVASLEPRRGQSVYGYVAKVTAPDLAVMDRYEGVAGGSYQRKTLQVKTPSGRVSAVAYASTSRDHMPPSREYLEAVAKTIGAFWRGADGGPVKWSDITVR